MTPAHFEWYGGKGVHVDPRWFEFRAFVEDAQKLEGWHLKRTYPEKYKLDKDFHNSNRYSAKDCVWLNERESHLNTTVTKLVRATRPDGQQIVTMDLRGLCDDYNLDHSTICKVMRGARSQHKGWTFAEEPIDPAAPPRVRIHDQIADVVALLTTSPTSRCMIVSAWNPAEIPFMKLPPCHCLFVVNVQNTERIVPHPAGLGGTVRRYDRELCLHLTQRSCDIALGVPYNIASYALLMHLFSRFSGIPVGTFSHTLVDAHAYTSKPDGSMAEYDHVPGLREQLTREPRPLPRMSIDSSITSLDDIPRLLKLSTDDVMALFRLDGYDPHPAINFKVAV